MVNTKSNDMIDFSASVRNFAERKICLQPQRLQIHLSNAKEVLNAGLQHFLGVIINGNQNMIRWQTG